MYNISIFNLYPAPLLSTSTNRGCYIFPCRMPTQWSRSSMRVPRKVKRSPVTKATSGPPSSVAFLIPTGQKSIQIQVDDFLMFRSAAEILNSFFSISINVSKRDNYPVCVDYFMATGFHHLVSICPINIQTNFFLLSVVYSALQSDKAGSFHSTPGQSYL